MCTIIHRKHWETFTVNKLPSIEIKLFQNILAGEANKLNFTSTNVIPSLNY